MRLIHHKVEEIEGLPKITIENYVDEQRAILLFDGEYLPPSKGLYKVKTSSGERMELYVQEISYDYIPRVWCNDRELTVDNRKPLKYGLHIGLYYMKKYVAKLLITLILGLVAALWKSSS